MASVNVNRRYAKAYREMNQPNEYNKLFKIIIFLWPISFSRYFTLFVCSACSYRLVYIAIKKMCISQATKRYERITFFFFLMLCCLWFIFFKCIVDANSMWKHKKHKKNCVRESNLFSTNIRIGSITINHNIHISIAFYAYFISGLISIFINGLQNPIEFTFSAPFFCFRFVDLLYFKDIHSIIIVNTI